MGKFVLPELPYAFDALEPYIDARTMEIHHDKHHGGYVNKLNAAIAQYPKYFEDSLEHLVIHYDEVPLNIQTAVRNNAGGHLNHSLFWTIMKKDGGGQPRDRVKEAIRGKWEEFDAFKYAFNEAAKSVFGSGWAWLVLDKEGRIDVITTPNQDTPLKLGYYTIFGLDVWEHAYYLKYQNRRVDYIQAWWNVINWDQIEENYEILVK